LEVSTADLRQYYSSLTDEMLRAIDPADLTDSARRCYDREIEKRKLGSLPAEVSVREPRQAAPLPDGSPEAEPDWIDNAACPCSFNAFPGTNKAPDAERACQVLAAAGIPSRLVAVPPESSKEQEPSSTFGEFRVMVPDALNLKALSVLDCEIFNPDLEAEWRAHFASLSDDQLHLLSPEVICAGLLDRVERLTRVYNDEIAMRRSNP